MSKNYFDTLCSKEAPTTMSKPTGKKKAKTDKLSLKKIKQQLLHSVSAIITGMTH